MCKDDGTRCICKRCDLMDKQVCDPCTTESVLVRGIECCENANSVCNLYRPIETIDEE